MQRVQYFPVRRIRNVSGNGSIVEPAPAPTGPQRHGHERMPGETEEDYAEFLHTIPADQAILALGDEMTKELTGKESEQ